MYTRAIRYLVSESAWKRHSTSYAHISLLSLPGRRAHFIQQIDHTQKLISRFSSNAAGSPPRPSGGSSIEEKYEDSITEPENHPEEHGLLNHENPPSESFTFRYPDSKHGKSSPSEHGIPHVNSFSIEGERGKADEGTAINAKPISDDSRGGLSSMHSVQEDENLDPVVNLDPPKMEHTVKVNSIPPLPPPVSGYPTPWVLQEDVERYLIPLYSRGWGVQFRHENTTSNSVTPETIDSEAHPGTVQKCRSAQLYMSYHFSDFYSAVSFVNDVVDITRTENHHPSFSIVNHGVPEIVLLTLTDSAIRPVWEDDEKHQLTTRMSRKLRGITLRDLRLAILVETLYTNVYVADGRGIDVERQPRALRQRPNWSQLLKLQQKYTYPQVKSSVKPEVTSPQSPHSPTVHRHTCPACGGPHTLLRCAARSDILPPHLCKICGDEHWMIDCPRRRTLKGRLRSPRICKKCGGTHPPGSCSVESARPPYPCPNCGGDHWKVHCRQPQVSPDVAAMLTLPVP